MTEKWNIPLEHQNSCLQMRCAAPIDIEFQDLTYTVTQSNGKWSNFVKPKINYSVLRKEKLSYRIIK